jgi:hypothetical protein
VQEVTLPRCLVSADAVCEDWRGVGHFDARTCAFEVDAFEAGGIARMKTSGGLRVACAGLIAGSLAGCGDSGPPSDYFVRGSFNETTERVHDLVDGIVWNVPLGSSRYVLLSDRKLPTLADDPYAPLDIDVALHWQRAPRVMLFLDASGKLEQYAVWGEGGSSAACQSNPGACSSAVAYNGPDALAAGYGFRDAVDASLALPVRQPAASVVLMTDGMYGAYDEFAPMDGDDGVKMYAVYVALRAALDANDTDAFFRANGFDDATAHEIGAMSGMKDALARFASDCPVPTRFEPLSEYPGRGALLVYRADGEYVPVYFRRRGDGWVLTDCGGG